MGAVGRLPFTKSVTALPSLVRHLDHVTHASQSRSTRVSFQDFRYRRTKTKQRNHTWLERESQKQFSDTHKTPYYRVKRCQEHEKNVNESERVNTHRHLASSPGITPVPAQPAGAGPSRGKLITSSRSVICSSAKRQHPRLRYVFGQAATALHYHRLWLRKINTMLAYNRQKAKSKYRTHILLEKASQKQFMKRYRELKKKNQGVRVRQGRHIHAKQTAVSRGGVVVRLLASHRDEPGSIPSGLSSGFQYVVIVPDDAAGRRIFLGDLPFPPELAFRRCSILTSVLEVATIDLEAGVQTTPKVVQGTGEGMLQDGIDSCTIDLELQRQTLSPDFVVIGFSGLPPTMVANFKGVFTSKRYGYEYWITPPRAAIISASLVACPKFNRCGLRSPVACQLSSDHGQYERSGGRAGRGSSRCGLGAGGTGIQWHSLSILQVLGLEYNEGFGQVCTTVPLAIVAVLQVDAGFVGEDDGIPWLNLIWGPRWPSGQPARLPPRRTGYNPRPGHLIFACGNRAGRCRWSADFLGHLPFPPPFHSDATPDSPQTSSSALKTSLLRAAQISEMAANAPYEAARPKQVGIWAVVVFLSSVLSLQQASQEWSFSCSTLRNPSVQLGIQCSCLSVPSHRKLFPMSDHMAGLVVAVVDILGVFPFTVRSVDTESGSTIPAATWRVSKEEESQPLLDQGALSESITVCWQRHMGVSHFTVLECCRLSCWPEVTRGYWAYLHPLPASLGLSPPPPCLIGPIFTPPCLIGPIFTPSLPHWVYLHPSLHHWAYPHPPCLFGPIFTPSLPHWAYLRPLPLPHWAYLHPLPLPLGEPSYGRNETNEQVVGPSCSPGAWVTLNRHVTCPYLPVLQVCLQLIKTTCMKLRLRHMSWMVCTRQAPEARLTLTLPLDGSVFMSRIQQSRFLVAMTPLVANSPITVTSDYSEAMLKFFFQDIPILTQAIWRTDKVERGVEEDTKCSFEKGGGGGNTSPAGPRWSSGYSACIPPRRIEFRFFAKSPPAVYHNAWGSCRTMPLVGGFSRGSPVFPRAALNSTRFTLIGSQNLYSKSHPNLPSPLYATSPKRDSHLKWSRSGPVGRAIPSGDVAAQWLEHSQVAP
ncbi:hypothetical protein PR048_020659 [Dryococelus australis]|uniref:Uncharacterized protein n=1 Tax=Dryococelus australis TaxID=614101 RepID=A0ABQ9H6W9_9NEOP|nr:hypothetical protein PR048_020659 [Dryococelus australis]